MYLEIIKSVCLYIQSFPCSSADELLFLFVTGTPKTLLHDRWLDRLDCALASYRL